jgi:hypothetical protein
MQFYAIEEKYLKSWKAEQPPPPPSVAHLWAWGITPLPPPINSYMFTGGFLMQPPLPSFPPPYSWKLSIIP